MKKSEFSKINPTRFALAFAIVWSFMILFTSLFNYFGIFGGFPLAVSFIVDIYGNFGYSTSLFGAFLGMVYSFIDAFVITWIFAWLYNWLLDR